jgi:hypothetical protein
MSNKLRNPFKMRASERIESDVSFLRLYSHVALEALIDKHNKGELWNQILFIRSSPGAGKTSLLRIFEPNSLHTLFTHRSSPDYRDLFNSLKKLEVISDESVQTIGVILSGTRNYGMLDDLNISEGQKLRLFYALLNSRLVLAFLKGICDLYKYSFPDNLDVIKFNFSGRNGFQAFGIPNTGSGRDLHLWASQIERNVQSSIDSFRPIKEDKVGHDEFFAIDILKPEHFSIASKPICSKILIMLDDAHKFTLTQRDSLIKYLVERRTDANVWISERLEALQPEDHFASYNKRDYQEINLERFWASHQAQFEKILHLVASKRAIMSTDQVNSFIENLENDLEEDVYELKIKTAVDAAKANIIKMASYSSKFDTWIKYVNDLKGHPWETALILKQIEILISRNLGKTQLAFDFPLTVEELNDKMDGSTAAAALLFLSKEFKIPYYYGFKNLVKIATNNIEQFLAFSSELFEGILSNGIAGNQVLLSTETQEKIIKKVVEEKWKELPKLIPQSNQVITFLTEFGNFSNRESYKANAPYAPGVTGFSVVDNPNNGLIPEQPWLKNSIHERLVEVLSICLAYNLLDIKEVNQGVKGKIWKVFYLNRWICIKFNLPLNYGGWRPRKADELLKWIPAHE